MSREIRRENFADEASWLEFQANQIELAKHKRERETAQKHAMAGRDYDVVKKMRQRAKDRAYRRRWREQNPEKARAKSRHDHHIWYLRHTELAKTRQRAWYARNHTWVLQQKRWYYMQHHEDILARRSGYYKSYYQANREKVLKKNRDYEQAHQQEAKARRKAWYEKKKLDPEWLESRRKRNREYQRTFQTRKRAEKLAQQQQRDDTAA